MKIQASQRLTASSLDDLFNKINKDSTEAVTQVKQVHAWLYGDLRLAKDMLEHKDHVKNQIFTSSDKAIARCETAIKLLQSVVENYKEFKNIFEKEAK